MKSSDQTELEGVIVGIDSDNQFDIVLLHQVSTPSGTPLAVTTDRVRLKSGALTARVKSIQNATDFVVDNLPGNFLKSGVLTLRAPGFHPQAVRL